MSFNTPDPVNCGGVKRTWVKVEFWLAIFYGGLERGLALVMDGRPTCLLAGGCRGDDWLSCDGERLRGKWQKGGAAMEKLESDI